MVLVDWCMVSGTGPGLRPCWGLQATSGRPLDKAPVTAYGLPAHDQRLPHKIALSGLHTSCCLSVTSCEGYLKQTNFKFDCLFRNSLYHFAVTGQLVIIAYMSLKYAIVFKLITVMCGHQNSPQLLSTSVAVEVQKRTRFVIMTDY